MPQPDLHIVTFAVPYPASYGGAIDVWNRLSALRQLGVNISLHCFVYKDFRPDPQLSSVAHSVHYYPRVLWPALMAKGQPYIVSSRKSPELLNHLQSDHLPVLFEGVHTTGFAAQLHKRKRFLRSHNIEHQYYARLAENTNGFKSLIYRRESQCLESYEQETAGMFDAVFAISPEDQHWYAALDAHVSLLTPFHGYHEVDIRLGRGGYILYQGDLSLEINQNAVLHLIHQWATDPFCPLVVAGKSGERSFEEKLKSFPNLQREADVSQEKMMELIRNAQIILIHSLHRAGMKLKIFPALFHGRFVASSEPCRTNTVLDGAMHFYHPERLQEMLHSLWPVEFIQEHLHARREVIARHPGDLQKAEEIIRYL